jgi:hypothetical protein
MPNKYGTRGGGGDISSWKPLEIDFEDGAPLPSLIQQIDGFSKGKLDAWMKNHGNLPLLINM